MSEYLNCVPMKVNYNPEDDTVTFTFTDTPEPGNAEEAADEVWVRYEPETHRVLTVDVLDFSKRVKSHSVRA